MSDYVMQFHKEAIMKVYIAFSEGLPYYYNEFVDDADASVEKAEEIIDAFYNVIDLEMDSLMRAFSSEIRKYMIYYNIETRTGVDEYKIIYFLGARMAAFLKRVSVKEDDIYSFTAKVMWYATIVMLDTCLNEYTNGCGRPILKNRLKHVIMEGQVLDRMGSDGIYLIYKCAGNMLKDHKNTEV